LDIATARTHEHRLIESSHGHRAVHGTRAAGRLNAFVAVHVTRAVGSMWCAYAFAALALVSLPRAIQSGDTVIIVSWISQTFLQLVLLSVIIVGQNVLAAASDARAETDHRTLQAIHTLTVAIHEINEGQNQILERLDKRSAQ
jgi:hypothetical protein